MNTRNFDASDCPAFSPLHPPKREAPSSIHFGARLRDNGSKSIKLAKSNPPPDTSITQEALHNQEVVQPIPEGGEALFTSGDPLAVLLIPESMAGETENYDSGILDLSLVPELDEAVGNMENRRSGDDNENGVDLQKEIRELWKEYKESYIRLGKKIMKMMNSISEEV